MSRRNKRLGQYEADLGRVVRPLREVLEAAVRAGATITETTRHHLKVRCPDGTVIMVSAHPGPAAQEAARTRRRLARAGIPPTEDE